MAKWRKFHCLGFSEILELGSRQLFPFRFMQKERKNVIATSNIGHMGHPSWGVHLIISHSVGYHTQILMGQIMLLVQEFQETMKQFPADNGRVFYSQQQQTNGIRKNNTVTCCFQGYNCCNPLKLIELDFSPESLSSSSPYLVLLTTRLYTCKNRSICSYTNIVIYIPAKCSLKTVRNNEIIPSFKLINCITFIIGAPTLCKFLQVIVKCTNRNCVLKD